MSVPAAYLGVILIWTTTPLAIQWSSNGPGFLFGVTGRMLIGVVLAWLMLRLMGEVMPWHRRARKTYLAAGLGIFCAMLLVYWSAQFIPSGWISVIFGITPMITGLMAQLWLQEERLTPIRLTGMLLGLSGLGVAFLEQGQAFGAASLLGVAGVLVSTLVHSASAVWIKRIDAGLPGLTVTVGGLMVAAPLFLLSWFLADAHWPAGLTLRAGAAILYLGVFGSVLGFALYYFVLRQVAATKVALITLITPVTALLLGHFLNGEALDGRIWIGVGLISAGLFTYQFGERWRLAEA